MKRLIIVLVILAAAQRAVAIHCYGAPPGRPCDPGILGAEKKAEIISLIKRANNAEPDVKKLKARYLAVRANPKATSEQKYAALEPYRTAKKVQDQLYKKAMDETSALYHVGPDQASLTIGQPEDVDMNYMSGLTAVWNPQAAEFDPQGLIGVKIKGSDGLFHYGGAVKDASKGLTTQAATFEDGRVFVFKEVFELALKYKNPGYLAQQLYHESRHFNQLSRPSVDGSGVPRSWASVEEDERDALGNVIDEAEAFGLDTETKDDIARQWATNDQRVKFKLLTRRTIDPAKEALRKKFYEEGQLNLEEEYEALKASIRENRLKQDEQQRLDREERERLAALEQERLEKERAARERGATPEEMAAELARCWYQPIYRNRTDDTIIGFKDKDHSHAYLPGENADLQGLKITMLITRACDDVYRGVPPDNFKTCNDAAPDLRNPMSFDLRQQIEQANSSPYAECAEHILTNASRITDSRSFNKVVTDYHTIFKKKRADDAKRDRKERERNERDRKERERGGNTAPPGNGDGNDHFWDPSCNCWVRRY